MLRTRIIPCLQLMNESLVKTHRFGKHQYIGDPLNTVRIFNELEVDELCFLDIRATSENREPNLNLLREIANECFMPLSYGGGIRSAQMAANILTIGFEKVILNTTAYQQPQLVEAISTQYGNQAVVVSIDVKPDFWGKPKVWIDNGKTGTNTDPIQYAKQMEQAGAGELLVTSMLHENEWNGLDIPLISSIANAVSIPVIAHGGAGSIQHIAEAVHKGKASAVALGSMVVFQKKGMGVLVNFPDQQQLANALHI